jgi:hypothetical protein
VSPSSGEEVPNHCYRSIIMMMIFSQGPQGDWHDLIALKYIAYSSLGSNL